MREVKDTWKKLEEISKDNEEISLQPKVDLPKNFTIRFINDQKTQTKSISFEFDKKFDQKKKFRQQKGYEITTQKAPERENFILLNVKLLDNNCYDLFKNIISDQLVESTLKCKTDLEATKNLFERVHKIGDFFRPKYEGLSKAEVIGIFGELVFLNGYIIKNRNNIKDSINSWTAPEALHDFTLKKNRFEVKSTASSPVHYVNVSEPKQLDSSLIKGKIYLIVFEIQEDDGPNGASLPQLIKKIESRCEENQDIKEKFKELLNTRGYFEEHESKYKDDKFIPSGVHSFLIDEKFPNLDLSNKPKQIENLKYDIDITQCDDWKKNIDEIIEIIKKS